MINAQADRIPALMRAFFGLVATFATALSAAQNGIGVPPGAAFHDGTGVPKTMRAAAFDQVGGPDVLTIHSLPVPQIGANEVLVAVRTAGVSIWDAANRQRLAYIAKPHFPVVVGSDAAGIVAAVGSAVRTLAVGDAVYASCWDNPKGGFYAEYAAVSAQCVARLPKGITLTEAGALGTSGLTALEGIDRVLHLKRGESLIIHGASGAVGTLAVQFARLRGARVLATASGEDGIALVHRLGADAAVESRNGDIAAAARRFAPHGADALLALAAGDGLRQCMDALRPGGRIAYPNGVEPVPKPRAGVTVVAYDAIEGPEDVELARLNKAIESRRFAIPVAAEFSLAEAAKAHERLAAGHVLGKILLEVR